MNNKLSNKKELKSETDVDHAQSGALDEATIRRIEEKIDRDLRDSFPASDPPGWTLGI